jgi:hypothetical protein
MRGKTPCHATLAETLRALDGRALADALGAVCLVEGKDQRHYRRRPSASLGMWGKTMRASKHRDGQSMKLGGACAGGILRWSAIDFGQRGLARDA